jgi:hypothetical protein
MQREKEYREKSNTERRLPGVTTVEIKEEKEKFQIKNKK